MLLTVCPHPDPLFHGLPLPWSSSSMVFLFLLFPFFLFPLFDCFPFASLARPSSPGNAPGVQWRALDRPSSPGNAPGVQWRALARPSSPSNAPGAQWRAGSPAQLPVDRGALLVGSTVVGYTGSMHRLPRLPWLRIPRLPQLRPQLRLRFWPGPVVRQ